MERRLIGVVVAFVLAGVAIADCLVILFQDEPTSGKVPLENSVPAALGGASVGFMCGVFATWNWHIKQRVRKSVTILAATVLCASLGAMLGGLCTFGIYGMAIGASIGVAIGIPIGFAQCKEDLQDFYKNASDFQNELMTKDAKMERFDRRVTLVAWLFGLAIVAAWTTCGLKAFRLIP